MFVRVCCVRCRLSSLWTDDPECFLATVCGDRRRCEAALYEESFGSALAAKLLDAEEACNGG